MNVNEIVDSLKQDAERLAAVHKADAHEATVFYCARMLESLLHSALPESRHSTAHNLLLQIEARSLMSRAQRAFAHGLRALGNDVRHLKRPVASTDASLAVGMLSCLLRWRARLRGGSDENQGRRVASVRERVAELVLDRTHAGVLRVLDALSRELDSGQLTALWGGEREAFGESAVLGVLLVEKLLMSEDSAKALEVADDLVQTFENDYRLRQKRALALRERNELDKALEVLRQLAKENGEDEETQGFLAGTYKRLADEHADGDQRRHNFLTKAHETYRKCWDRSRKRGRPNTYHGINAASTALMLGEARRAREMAELVRDCFDLSSGGRAAFGGYWDHVTLAECLLLQGRIDSARRQYRRAFEKYATERRGIRSAKEQIGRVLQRLGMVARTSDPLVVAEAFMESGADLTGGPVSIGIVGHRDVTDTTELRAAIRKVLRTIQKRCGRGTRMVLFTQLAEGADRLVAEIGCGKRFKASLCCVLPLELDDYVQDFPASRGKFGSFLRKADHIIYPVSPDASRPDAYMVAGKRVVDECTAIIAIWDHEPALGYGGTADVVEYARRKGKPTAIVHASRLASTEDSGKQADEDGAATEVGLSDPLVTRLTAHYHAVWARRRVAGGWRYGKLHDDVELYHPELVAFEDLPQGSQQRNRRDVVNMLRAIADLGWDVGKPAGNMGES